MQIFERDEFAVSSSDRKIRSVNLARAARVLDQLGSTLGFRSIGLCLDIFFQLDNSLCVATQLEQSVTKVVTKYRQFNAEGETFAKCSLSISQFFLILDGGLSLQRNAFIVICL